MHTIHHSNNATQLPKPQYPLPYRFILLSSYSPTEKRRTHTHHTFSTEKSPPVAYKKRDSNYCESVVSTTGRVIRVTNDVEYGARLHGHWINKLLVN